MCRLSDRLSLSFGSVPHDSGTFSLCREVTSTLTATMLQAVVLPPVSAPLMWPLIRGAVFIGFVLSIVACGQEPDPSSDCPTGSVTARASQPIGAYRIYVDGSRSMAPFLAPSDAEGSVTPYEEMLFRLFTAIAPQDSAETWLFGDTLVHLPYAPAARQQLVTRGTYQRGQSRLEFAFRSAQAYLDSLGSARGDSVTARPASRRAGVSVIVTDGLQSGSGRQLHILAEFDRMIRDHVSKGGSFAFVAGLAGRYPEKGAGAVRPEGTKPVLVFLFGSGTVRNEVEGLARELAEALNAQGEAGNGRFFVLPVGGATAVRLRPRTGVQQVLSAQGEPPVFTFATGSQAVEIVADAELSAATRASLPPLLVVIERCAGGRWERAGDPAGWSADSVRVDSAGNGVHLTLRRRDAASVRSGFFRVRLEGSPVPPWVGAFGADRERSEDDVGRFFGGLRDLTGTDAASFGAFYLRVRSD